VKILFRCDGSIKLGMGHVVRCLALAKKLQDNQECKIYFAMRDSSLGIEKVEKKYPVITPSNSNFIYKKWMHNCLKLTNAQILIMDVRDDLLKEDIIYLKKLNNLKVVTIDDPQEKRLEADLAFYPPVPQLDKMKWNGFNGELCIGWDYAIIREEFSNSFSKKINPIPEVLISMGATDEKNMTQSVLKALSKIGNPIKINIIIGSGYPHIYDLNNELKKYEHSYNIYKNPSNVSDIMNRCDFAIISFGVTAYELASLEIPSFYISHTDDHLESSKLFVENGFGFSLGVFSTKIIEKITKQVSIYLSKNRNKNFYFKKKKIIISNIDKIAKKILKL
jgi:UDP-2,4-diacetamido-2,4,6-trideoxy-beta-L-altropyranose hydrolase